MGVPAVNDVQPSKIAQILRDLGLDPKLTIEVHITAAGISAQVIALDDNGVLIRNASGGVVHEVSIPLVESGDGTQPAESP